MNKKIQLIGLIFLSITISTYPMIEKISDSITHFTGQINFVQLGMVCTFFASYQFLVKKVHPYLFPKNKIQEIPQYVTLTVHNEALEKMSNDFKNILVNFDSRLKTIESKKIVEEKALLEGFKTIQDTLSSKLEEQQMAIQEQFMTLARKAEASLNFKTTMSQNLIYRPIASLSFTASDFELPKKPSETTIYTPQRK